MNASREHAELERLGGRTVGKVIAAGFGSMRESGSWLDTAEAFARRLLDIVVSVTLLVLLAPLMVIVALVIKVAAPGPCLFRQLRVGANRRRDTGGSSTDGRRKKDLHGKPFVFYKFRTMYSDARTRFPELYDYTYSEEQRRALPMKVLMSHKLGSPDGDPKDPKRVPNWLNDPRVPPACRWLRKTSLDELPNLFNVLKGDMHLVGPRPDLLEHTQYYDDRELKKLSVKPGVTGLAQVNGRGLLTFEQTLDYDIEFVEHRSLWLELKVLVATIPRLFRGTGAI